MSGGSRRRTLQRSWFGSGLPCCGQRSGRAGGGLCRWRVCRCRHRAAPLTGRHARCALLKFNGAAVRRWGLCEGPRPSLHGRSCRLSNAGWPASVSIVLRSLHQISLCCAEGLAACCSHLPAAALPLVCLPALQEIEIGAACRHNALRAATAEAAAACWGGGGATALRCAGSPTPKAMQHWPHNPAAAM